MSDATIREVRLALGDEKAAGIDEDILAYIAGTLEDEGITDVDELEETIGPFIEDADIVPPDEVHALCNTLFARLKGNPEDWAGRPSDGVRMQGGPVNLRAMADAQDLSAILDVELDMSGVRKLNYVLKTVDMARIAKINARNEKKLAERAEKQELEDAKARAKRWAVLNDKDVDDAVAAAASRTPASATKSRSKDIVIEDIYLSYGPRELLVAARFVASHGRRYGLVGHNGCGKTTLLKHMVKGVYAIPDHISMLLVEQEVVGDDTPAIDSVISADAELLHLLHEAARLEKSDDEADSIRLGRVYDALADKDAASAQARAATILSGLQFTEEMQLRPTKHFSGGWRMRIALARALFLKPDVLLLDEPTNHLDLYAELWLQEFLAGWKNTVIVVSHSRSFLNNVTTDIIHVFNKRLDAYKGNYEDFEHVRSERLMEKRRAAASQAARVKHIQGFIDRFRANAKRASMAQSRVKMLEKMQKVVVEEDEYAISFSFPQPSPAKGQVVVLKDVTFGYKEGVQVLRNVDLSVSMQSRVAVVGPNGAGKSTLMKIIAKELLPQQGSVTINCKLGFFKQHHVDALKLDQTPVAIMMAAYPGNLVKDMRTHLGRFGITGRLATKPIQLLSGGQKSRVAFAKLAFSRPQIIIADEPSNHLDLESIEALAYALNEFEGGVVLVSHDQYLISLTCDEIWTVDDGCVNHYDGDIEQYRKDVLKDFKGISRDLL